MLDGPLLLAQVVEGIARRGDVTIPEFHVFATPRSSEVFRLIFPEGQAAWPGIVLVVTVVAVIAEALRLAAVSALCTGHCPLPAYRMACRPCGGFPRRSPKLALFATAR